MINIDFGTIYYACLVRRAYRLAHLIAMNAVNRALAELHRLPDQAKVEIAP